MGEHRINRGKIKALEEITFVVPARVRQEIEQEKDSEFVTRTTKHERNYCCACPKAFDFFVNIQCRARILCCCRNHVHFGAGRTRYVGYAVAAHVHLSFVQNPKGVVFAFIL